MKTIEGNGLNAAADLLRSRRSSEFASALFSPLAIGAAGREEDP